MYLSSAKSLIYSFLSSSIYTLGLHLSRTVHSKIYGMYGGACSDYSTVEAVTMARLTSLYDHRSQAIERITNRQTLEKFRALSPVRDIPGAVDRSGLDVHSLRATGSGICLFVTYL